MNQDTLDKINALTRRDFTENEIYTFPVTLCHNDIDRDGERFSDTALEQMAKLFIGKTGIFDHKPTVDNQAARIYDAEVVTDAEKLTQDGRTFRYLKGYDGKSQYIQLADCISYRTTDGEIINAEHDAIGNKAIAFVGTSGVQLGWFASQADMLADDWMIVG